MDTFFLLKRFPHLASGKLLTWPFVYLSLHVLSQFSLALPPFSDQLSLHSFLGLLIESTAKKTSYPLMALKCMLLVPDSPSWLFLDLTIHMTTSLRCLTELLNKHTMSKTDLSMSPSFSFPNFAPFYGVSILVNGIAIATLLDQNPTCHLWFLSASSPHPIHQQV